MAPIGPPSTENNTTFVSVVVAYTSLNFSSLIILKDFWVSDNEVDNEVSALARLTFYEKLFIGQETSVHCPH